MNAVKDTGRYDVLERAEQAGKFRPLREQALHPDSPDSEIAALRRVASRVATLGLDVEKPPKSERKQTEKLSRPEQIVARMSAAATQDDGYRVQLIDLAAVRGGIYRQALDRLYGIEKETLGRWEALARLLLDSRQLVETQKRDAQACQARPPDVQGPVQVPKEPAR